MWAISRPVSSMEKHVVFVMSRISGMFLGSPSSLAIVCGQRDGRLADLDTCRCIQVAFPRCD